MLDIEIYACQDRMLAKIEIYSRHQLTLLHSNVTARPKQVTRNFKGDEKMPVAELHYVRLFPSTLIILYDFLGMSSSEF